MRRRSSARDARHVEANVSRKALRWLLAEAERLCQFAPGVTPGEAQQTAIAELGLAAWLFGRWNLPAEEPSAADVLRQRVGAAYARPELHSFAFTGPPEAFVGQLFMRLGAGRMAQTIIGNDALQRLMEERNVLLLERAPVRTLELRFVLDALELAHDLPSRRTLVELGILRRPLNVDALWPSNIYSITHVIFFATEYGVRTHEVFSAEDLAELDATTSHLVEVTIGQEHWDLLAELILARKCLGLSGSDAVAWQALAGVQHADGSFPSASRRNSADDAFLRVLTAYHKCLVTALAGYFDLA